MNKSLLKKLDLEHRGRLDELLESSCIPISDVFSHQDIPDSIALPKLFLPHSDVTELISAYPFYPRIFVSLCPGCAVVKNPEPFHQLLKTHNIIPILYSSYSRYPEEFIKKVVLPHSHISAHEFLFFRRLVLMEKIVEGAICSHCVKLKRDKLITEVQKKTSLDKNVTIARAFFDNLHPYIAADFELYELFMEAVANSDGQLIDQLLDLSFALYNSRSSEVLYARSTISRDIFPLALKATKEIPDFTQNSLTEINDILANELNISFPKNMPVHDYIKFIEPYREELSTIVESLLEESEVNNELSYSKLSSKISELNENIHSLSKKKRFLLFRASMAFLKSNNTLLASGLLAGILGLYGSPIGCSLSAAGGVGLEVAKRIGKIKLPPEAEKLGKEIGYSIRPQINKLIAKCLNLDVRAIQISEIQEKFSAENK